jgi:hypothetical protein
MYTTPSAAASSRRLRSTAWRHQLSLLLKSEAPRSCVSAAWRRCTQLGCAHAGQAHVAESAHMRHIHCVQAKSPINKRARAPVRPSKTMLSTAFNAPEAMVGAQKVSFSHGTELGEHHWYPPLPSHARTHALTHARTRSRMHALTHAHSFPFAYRRGLSGPFGSLYGHTFRRHHPFHSAPLAHAVCLAGVGSRHAHRRLGTTSGSGRISRTSRWRRRGCVTDSAKGFRAAEGGRP